jgi:hypothetical protein
LHIKPFKSVDTIRGQYKKSICVADLLFTREQFQEMARVIRYVKDLLLHHAEPCTAERWVGFALMLREVASVLELGLAEAALALGAFRRVADRTLGRAGRPWYVSYRVRMGLK